MIWWTHNHVGEKRVTSLLPPELPQRGPHNSRNAQEKGDLRAGGCPRVPRSSRLPATGAASAPITCARGRPGLRRPGDRQSRRPPPGKPREGLSARPVQNPGTSSICARPRSARGQGRAEERRWTRHPEGLDRKNPSLRDAPGSLLWLGWAGHLSCALGLYGPHPRPALMIPPAQQPSSPR